MLTLESVVTPKTVKTRLGATTKFEAIQELLDLLVSSADLSLRRLPKAQDAVFRTERSQPSGTDTGVALPYGVVDGLTSPKAAIGISEKGIDFGGREPARLVVLLLYPTGTFQASHRLFPAVSDGLAVHGEDVDALASADTSAQVLKKLAEVDQRRAR